MHTSSMLRMQWFVDSHCRESGRRLRVLDVGSYDVNGSYRQFFPADRFDYVGLDMAEGPNVDLVPKHPYAWRELSDETFDIVISGQAFEHIEFFWVTLTEMARVLKKDGLLCVIAPNGFAEHRYPVDCYRFFTDGMVSLARYVTFDILHAHTNSGPTPRSVEWFSDKSADSMLVARRPYGGPVRTFDPLAYSCEPANHAALRQPFVPAPPRKKWFWKRLFGRRAG